MDTDPYEPPVKMRPPRQMPGKISDNQEMSQAQQSLAWKVRCRSNPEELFSKGILPDKERFANPVFLEQKRRLSIAKTSDTIKKKLVNRPDRGEFVNFSEIFEGFFLLIIVQRAH